MCQLFSLCQVEMDDAPVATSNENDIEQEQKEEEDEQEESQVIWIRESHVHRHRLKRYWCEREREKKNGGKYNIYLLGCVCVRMCVRVCVCVCVTEKSSTNPIDDDAAAHNWSLQITKKSKWEAMMETNPGMLYV